MRSVYIVLLLLWFLLGYFLCNKYLCNPSEPSATEAAIAAKTELDCEVELSFNDNDFMISSSENFRFNRSSDEMNDPSDVVLEVVTKVSEYLTENPDRFMLLTGYYAAGEENYSDYDNLGIARAKKIEQYLSNNGIDKAQINTTGELLETYCFDGDTFMRGTSVQFGAITE